MAEKPTATGSKVTIKEPPGNEAIPDGRSDLFKGSCSQKSLFDDPLPKWLVWPLDSKLPMVTGPQKAELYTTKLGEKIIQSYPELDFDLWDPNAYDTPTSYDALHDPHLHKLFESRHFREHLLKEGFITEDGKVLCNLKEFNKYRAYLNKLYQQLEKREREEEIEGRQSHHSRCGCHERPTLRPHSARKQQFHKLREKVRKRRQLEKMAAEVGVSILDFNAHINDAGRERVKTATDRMDRVRQVQERAKNKQKMDKVRMQKRLADDDIKRTRLRKEKERLLAERERLQQEQLQVKLNDMKDRQFMERQRRLDKIKQHLEDCNFRSESLASEKQAKLKLREEKLKHLWETRKCYQMNKIVMNQLREAQAKKERKTKVEHRRKLVQQQQEKHENMLKQTAEKSWLRHVQQEEELMRKLKERQAAACAALERRSGQQTKDKGDGPVSYSDTRNSTFDLTDSLLNFMRMVDKEEELMVEPYPDGEIDYSKRVQGVDPATVKIYSSLPVRNLLPTDWAPRGTPRDGWWNNYGLGIPKYKLVTSVFDINLATKIPQTIEEAAAKFVQMITFLASKVVYPAMLQAENDVARESEMAKRRQQKEEYEKMELERRRKEEKRKIRAKLMEERRKEKLMKNREEERKKAEETKAASPTKPIKPIKVLKPAKPTKQATPVKAAQVAKTQRPEKKKQGVKTTPKKLQAKLRRSSVQFNLAGNVDIPLTSPYVFGESASPVLDTEENELVYLHESEDDEESEDSGAPKVEANDSLTLLRRSKTHIPTELKPTKFASLLATEILATLQSVLVKPEDIIVPRKPEDQDVAPGTKADEQKPEVQSKHDLQDLHVTPLAKILVEQAVATVAEKLGIDIQIEKKPSHISQPHIPVKRSSGNIKALKGIDSKTPATVLMLAVLEAAAKQTGTQLDQALHVRSQEMMTTKKSSKTKKSSLEKAANTYGVPSSKPKAQKEGRHPLRSKEGSLSKTKPSEKSSSSEKPTKAISSENDIPPASGAASLSETLHVAKQVVEKVMRNAMDRSISSPQLIGSQALSATPQDPAEGKEAEHKEQTPKQVIMQDANKRTDNIAEEIKQDVTNATSEEAEVPKKKSSFFARVSSFLLSKRTSSKSDKSSVSEPKSDVVESHKETVMQERPDTRLSMSKSEESKVGTCEPADKISSPQLTDVSTMDRQAKLEQRITPTRSSQLINQLVRDQISRILYNAKVEYAKEIGVEVQHKDRKVVSDTKEIEGIVREQVSGILRESKPPTLEPETGLAKETEKMSDTEIIETVVKEQIHKIMLEDNLKPGAKKDKTAQGGADGVFLKQSTPAFAAIANAYASEMNVDVHELGTQTSLIETKQSTGEMSQTQHPIHLAILKKIASKIEKEEEIKKRKGLEAYRRGMASMLSLSIEDRVTDDFLQTVAERYKYSLREDPEKCKGVTDVEYVLKNNLITAINLIREGIMPNPQLMDLIGAVVASYLIAHSMLPLAEDTCVDASFARYKGAEVGTWLTTPVLIDTLIAEILDNVKQHLRVGTFNAVHVIMAVYGMHRNSLEIVEKKEAEELAAKQPAPEYSSSPEELVAVRELDEEGADDTEFVPMYGDHPLGLGKDEASSALVALSVKDPGEIDSGTDAVERNSFLSLVRPDVSKLKTFTEADKTVSEEAARRHLSAVSMQFKKRSEAKFSPTAQAAMKGRINYEKLRRGSMPVMGSRLATEEVPEDSDESDEDETKEQMMRSRLRSQSIAMGMPMNKDLKITDPTLLAAKFGSKEKSSQSLHKVVASDESVVKAVRHGDKSGSSIESKSSDQNSELLRIVSGSQSLNSDEEAEVPPEDPELVRLSARREKRAQEKAAEKQRHLEGGSKEELQEQSPSSSQKSSLHSSVASPRTSHGSIGTGLRPRPSSAFKSEKKDIEEPKQVAVQTSDHGQSYQIHDPAVCEIGVQVTGNEAAVQTSSSIRQYGRQGTTQAVGSDTLALLTPLTTSENFEFEYAKVSQSPDAGQTTSAGALEAAKGASNDSVSSRHTQSDKGGSQEPYAKYRPSSGPAGKIIQTETTIPQEAVQVLIQSHQELLRSAPNTMPQIQSAGSIQQKKTPNTEEDKTSSNTLVEEIVEYEEITEMPSPVSPKPASRRRMSFVPNFTAPAPIIGAYGQQNRRMSFFPGYEQKEQMTRNVLEKAMDPELPTSQTNRDNFIMDEDDDVQEVSPLVSVASAEVDEKSNESRQTSQITLPSSNRKSRVSKSPTSRKGSSRSNRDRTTNNSNNNYLPLLRVSNANNNNKICSHHESAEKIPLPLLGVVSPYKTGTAFLKRLHIGSTTLTTKVKSKDTKLDE